MDGSRLCCLLIAYLFYWRDEATYVLHWPTPEEEKLIQAHTDYPITYPDNGDGSSGSTAGPIMLIPVTSQIDKRVKKGVLLGMRALRLLRKRFFFYFTLKNDKRFYRNDFMWAIIFHQFDKSFRPHQSFPTVVINAVRHLLPLPLFSPPPPPSFLSPPLPHHLYPTSVVGSLTDHLQRGLKGSNLQLRGRGSDKGRRGQVAPRL